MQIPEVVYDTEAGKAASIIFPQGEYTYILTGTAEGVYTAIFQSFEHSSTPVEFVAQQIPTHLAEQHQFLIDWQKVAQGLEGVEVSVDQNGDGIFETQFVSDKLLTTEEFSQALKAKVTLCHIPPGNSENLQTIQVGAPAVKTHLAHGDYLGTCKNTIETPKKEKELSEKPIKLKKK